MKKYLLCALAATMSLCATAKNDNPVLMNVNGKDVKVSEFEYLFNKNNTQQAEPQSLDQYLQMFIDYKLKVADAEAAGIQNTPEFEQEFVKFRNELSEPYLRDAAVEDSLVLVSYNRRRDNVMVSHIMFKSGDYAKADSVRTAIVEGKTSFEDAARKFSVDRGSNQRGGLMGSVVPDRFPYAFEDMAYNTEVGGISSVVNSGIGLHIIRVESRKPSEGEVNASHILLDTRRLNAKQKEEAKAKIDSIYGLAVAGEDFGELARKFSNDPGSAARGGELGWFGRGMMVAEFDSVSFALADGEISKPFSTQFGYHIVKRIGHRGLPELDDKLRKEIIGNMARDSRGAMPLKARIAQLRKQFGVKVDDAAVAKLKSAVAGGYNAEAVEALKALNDLTVATVNGNKITFGTALPSLPETLGAQNDIASAELFITNKVEEAINNAVSEAYRVQLLETTPEFANLVNEYRDGILLFDISNRNVWDRATKDTEGLEKFFNENRDRYVWSEPKFKSFIIFAHNDSVLAKTLQYADSLSTDNPAQFVRDMRQRFGLDIKIERVIASKGENQYTDYLGFGGARPETKERDRWKSYAAYGGQVISQPQEAADVRGAALADYQAKLEKDWMNDLHKKYKVKVNEKVFNKLKKKYNK